MNLRIVLNRLALLFALFVLATPALAQTTEADFTRAMAERFRAALPNRAVEIPAPLQLRISNEGDPAEVNVGRLFNYCASSTPAECDSALDHFVAAMAEGLETLDAPITREQLRVAVRPTEYCDSLRPSAGSAAPATLVRPFGSDLCSVLMADYPTRMRGVIDEDLRALGLEPEAAWRSPSARPSPIFPIRRRSKACATTSSSCRATITPRA
jgi:hypothetical protein